MVTNAPHKGDAVIARGLAKVGKANGVGMCQKEIRQLFGVPSVGDFDNDGDADAHDAWKAAVKKGKVVKDRNLKNAPPGAYLYFSGGKHGHVALGLGGDLCVSTDAYKDGVWGKIAPSKLAKRWGMRYEGYIVVTGNGYRVFDLPAATAAVRYEVTAKKLNARQWFSIYSAVKAQRAKGFQFTSTVKSGKWVQASSLWYHSDFLKVIKPPSANPQRPHPGDLWFSLGTWNIAGANKKGLETWLDRRAGVLAKIQSQNDDIVCLQEAYLKSNDMEMLTWLLSRLPEYKLVVTTYGRAILVKTAKVTIIEKGVFAPKNKAVGHGTKYATWVYGKINGSVGILVNVHPQAGATHGGVRKKQIKEIDDLTEALRKRLNVPVENVVLAGDWNGREAANMNTRFVDASWSAAATVNQVYKSFNGWKSGLKKGNRIDYLRVAKGRPLIDVRQSDDSKLSDHNYQTARIARFKK